MPSASLAQSLTLFGPRGQSATPTLSEARQYCRQLAQSHYENFTVASWLLPRRLLSHFHAIYAYCRWADDLADESGDPQESLALLEWWERELADCYRGVARHPVFVALHETVREFEIPIGPFADLLMAFRQDQHVTRYAGFEDLLGYCRNSANPVGRLVLYLGRSHTPQCLRLSDSVCTGLQLANFCQDVAGDWARGRVYLPQTDCAGAGYSEAMFERREFNAPFRGLMTDQVDRAEHFLREGWPLVGLVPRELRLDVALFIAGGLKILAAIRRIDYNVWERRPTVSRREQLGLLARCWWHARRGTQGWRA